jgi:hypothetical protein
MINVIQEERGEVNKTLDGGNNKSTKATTDKGNNINNGERMEVVEKKDDSI